MKKSIILFLVAFVMGACQEFKPRYFSTSPEIDEVKALVDDYQSGNWDSWRTHYMDTAKIFHNSIEGVSIDVALRGLRNTVEFMDAYNFTDQEMFWEMVVDDDNMTWVYFWGTWKATVSGTGTELEIPVHIASLMVNGKIAAEYGFYDTHDIQLAVQDLVMDDDLGEEMDGDFDEAEMEGMDDDD